MTDRAAQAAEKIASDLDDRAGFEMSGVMPDTKAEMLASWTTIIRNAYAGVIRADAMQVRAEQLKRALAEVRAVCEAERASPSYSDSGYGRGDMAKRVLAILDREEA